MWAFPNEVRVPVLSEEVSVSVRGAEVKAWKHNW